ncbi:Protein of unknown function [Alteromonadaceae bacterium Bs31]|nr:Protein of unknown function [Alteromonadaceae bacterium Bs31]
MILKNIKKIAVLSMIIFLSTSTLAEETDKKDETVKKEDIKNFLADCGIGGAIFKHDVGGVISNIIWDWGLTATTSYVSSPETCEGVDVVAAEFIHRTYDNLVEETSHGEGSHIAALMSLYTCDAAQTPAAVMKIRSDLSQIVSGSEYATSSDIEKSQQYFSSVKSAVSACQA